MVQCIEPCPPSRVLGRPPLPGSADEMSLPRHFSISHYSGRTLLSPWEGIVAENTVRYLFSSASHHNILRSGGFVGATAEGGQVNLFEPPSSPDGVPGVPVKNKYYK